MELKPCPFCGGKGIKLLVVHHRRTLTSGPDTFNVACLHCGANGPFAYGRNMAINSWNNARPAPDVERLVDDTTNNIMKLMLMPSKDEYHKVRAIIQQALSVLTEQEKDVSLKPDIVCLCGSTRFADTFFDEGRRQTLSGHIVLSIGVYKSAAHHAGEMLSESVCRQLDELHKRKIDLADRVLILNVGGYVGDSTKSEIAYALEHNKPVSFLELDTADTILAEVNAKWRRREV